MKDSLNLSAETYDFNLDRLADIFNGKKFDVIFVRYAIGFCEDLKNFLEQCKQLLESGGCVNISFSPASRAVCARWMSDDYTYLRQYTSEYLKEACSGFGFNHIGEFDEGSYRWDDGLNFFVKFFASFYTKNLFSGVEEREKFQSNIALVFQMDR